MVEFSSHDRNKAYHFQLGAGRVIKGWEQGLVGMCPGEVRMLTIPPNLAYGDRGSGKQIPPGQLFRIYFKTSFKYNC